jgi:hypothetical protein
MPNQVVWPKCNVFDEDGNPTVLQRGDYLPDGVDDVQLETLMVIGAVRPVDVAPAAESAESESESEPEDETPELLQKPSPDDSKAAWVDYATDERNPARVSKTQANSMSKDALMARFAS